jgi:hypothetical protein
MAQIGSCLLTILLAAAGAALEAAPTEAWPNGRYDPTGRRDPFLPLIAPDEPDPIGGLEGIPWQRLVLVGIVEDPDGRPLALFYGGPGPMAHFLAPGARFRNGTLETIDPGRRRVVIRGPARRLPGPPERHILILAATGPPG